MNETADSVAAQPAPGSKAPAIHPLRFSDLPEILRAGLRDFRAALVYDLAIAGVYAIGGLALILGLLFYDLPYLIYPLAVGFALIAPFAAAAFYGVSRAIEQGQPVTWRGIFGSVRHTTRSGLGWMALVTVFALIIWMDIAAMLFFGFFGLRDFSATEFLQTLFTTPSGLVFFVLGNAIGAVISLAIFSLTVTSLPMLFDRPVDFITAMITSVKLVFANPGPMVAWSAVIGLLLAASLATALLGLFVTLPVLGHATWHLYRKAILPDATA
ncbi:MAG: DUF2189 domain-containing protein [Alphaproteobacteria bacterium]